MFFKGLGVLDIYGLRSLAPVSAKLAGVAKSSKLLRFTFSQMPTLITGVGAAQFQRPDQDTRNEGVILGLQQKFRIANKGKGPELTAHELVMLCSAKEELLFTSDETLLLNQKCKMEFVGVGLN